MLRSFVQTERSVPGDSIQKGGRPPKTTKAEVRQLGADPEADVGAMCETLGVSKSTLYTYVGPDGAVRKMPDR